MKTKPNYYAVFIRKMAMGIALIPLVFSCSKNTNDPTTTAKSYCGTINWSETIGVSGYIKGEMANGKYELTSSSITDDGTKTFTFNRDGAGHLINGSGFTYTYNQDNLVKIATSDGTGTGTGTFTFDNNSHLTKVDIENIDATDTSTINYTYTYDSNDDPIKIVANLKSKSSSGKTSAIYDITADYLTDKPNFLPLVPEMTPFSIYYAYGFYLSRHLINKWVIKINGTDDQGAAIPQINFTQQYTYTYDDNGNVATMVHTGNPNNIYTFTYSNCN